MRKSRETARHYRPGASREPVSLGTFRAQMTDYARGDRLRELRAEKRMSREKVANALDVTTKTVWAWENSGAIKWENAQKVAGFYGVQADEIATRESETLNPGYVELRRIEQKLDALLAHFAVEIQPETISEAVEKARTRLGSEGPPPSTPERRRRDRRRA